MQKTPFTGYLFELSTYDEKDTNKVQLVPLHVDKIKITENGCMISGKAEGKNLTYIVRDPKSTETFALEYQGWMIDEEYPYMCFFESREQAEKALSGWNAREGLEEFAYSLLDLVEKKHSTYSTCEKIYLSLLPLMEEIAE